MFRQYYTLIGMNSQHKFNKMLNFAKLLFYKKLFFMAAMPEN